MTKRFLYLVLCGFFLGLSIIAPGLSGSVIAIIMGVYQDLVRIVSNPFKRFKQNVKFCLPLAVGAVLSAVLFILVFQILFTKFEKATYLLLVGLIAGNLPVIFAEIKKCGFKKRYLLGGGAAFAAALILGIIAAGDGHSKGADAVSSALFMFALAGLAGGATALIPGMSVSMILIIMGVYAELIFAADSVLHFDLTYLLPLLVFAACAVVGLVLTSRGVTFVFDKYPGFAHSLVLGFLGGSLVGVFVQSLRLQDTGFNWLQGALALVIGLGISILFAALGKKMRLDAAQ